MGTTTLVAKGVYRIPLAWSNAYLLVEDAEAALIDTGLKQDRERLLAALREIGIAPRQLRSVYLTHGHCDHAGNAAFLAGGPADAQTNGEHTAVLCAHHAEASFLGVPRRTYAPRGWRLLTRPHAALAFTVGERLYPVERRAPHRLLSDGDCVAAPGGALKVIATPGHTPGHVAYFRERDGLLFSGDAILNIIPFKRVTDLSLPMPIFTDHWEQARRSALRLANLRPAILLSGHGSPVKENTATRLAAWGRTL